MDLRFWEEGAIGYGPTVSQLRRLANVYKRPIAAFLYDAPPKQQERLPDMRILGGHSIASWSPALHGAYRRALYQREAAIEVFGEEPIVLSAMPTVNLTDPPEKAALTISNWLGADVGPVVSDTSIVSMKLRDLSLRIEERGILVLQVQSVALEEMRGFAISERPYPAIAVNGADATNAKKFTILHELVHILLGADALCTMSETAKPSGHDHVTVERYCNRVGAAVLMPRALVLAQQEVDKAGPTSSWSEESLKGLAEKFRVSTEAMYVRLVGLGRASESEYWSWRESRAARYDSLSSDADESTASPSSGGPTYQRMKVRDYGRFFVLRMIAAFRRREIDESEVTTYLDVKFDGLDKLQLEAES